MKKQKKFVIRRLILIAVLIPVLFLLFYLVGKVNNTSKTGSDTQSATTQKPVVFKIQDEKIGDGREVKMGDTVVVNYIGTLQNGDKFDSSYDRNAPFETQIGVGRVIKGWDEGIIGMKVGGKRKLTVPPELGYGNVQQGPIPPNSTLIFDVELMGIK